MGVGSCGKKIVYQIIRHWSKLRTRKYDCRIVCSNIFSFRSINNVKVKTITSLLSNKNLLQTHIFSLIINDSDWYCFCREVPGCCRDNLVRDSYLICVLKIDSKKKTIKYLDPVKMWKIFPAWNADLKIYVIMIHIKKSCDNANMYLPEGTVTAVNFNMSGLRI